MFPEKNTLSTIRCGAWYWYWRWLRTVLDQLRGEERVCTTRGARPPARDDGGQMCQSAAQRLASRS